MLTIGRVPMKPDALRLAVSVAPATREPEIVSGAAARGTVAATAAVIGDMEETDPPPFRPVTTTRMREPTSGVTRVYVREVPPGMAAQGVPFEGQRCHV